MKILKIFCIFLLCMDISNILWAIDENAGTTGIQFLRIGIGARQTAMGEAFCAGGGDANTIFYNPAGLSQIQKTEISISHNNWLANINEQSIVGCYPTKWGNLGAGIVYLHMDEFTGYDIDSQGEPIRIPNFTAYDVSSIFSYSLPFKTIPIGINFKFFQERLENEQVSGVALDMGLNKKMNDNLSIGFAIQNLGQGVKFIEKFTNLPLNIKLGMGYWLFDKKLLFTADANKPIDNKIEKNFGMEYILDKIFALRAGYKNNNDLYNIISFGFGIVTNGWTIDYVFVPYEKLGNTHRVTLRMGLGIERKIIHYQQKKEYEKVKGYNDKEKIKIEEKFSKRVLKEKLNLEKGFIIEEVYSGNANKRIEIIFDDEVIFYSLARNEIRKEFYPILDKLAEYLQENSELKAEIIVYTNKSKNLIQNLQISRQRVYNINEYFVKTKNFPSSKFSFIGQGSVSRRPIIFNNIEEIEKDNCVEIIIRKIVS